VPTKLDAYKAIIETRLAAYPEFSAVWLLAEIRAPTDDRVSPKLVLANKLTEPRLFRVRSESQDLRPKSSDVKGFWGSALCSAGHENRIEHYSCSAGRRIFRRRPGEIDVAWWGEDRPETSQAEIPFASDLRRRTVKSRQSPQTKSECDLYVTYRLNKWSG